jgi:protein-S-isoprenylcysteine O-methyltransferase Ste14
MSERATGGWGPLLGSALFFCLAPGIVAGAVPYALNGWRVGEPFLSSPGTRVLGAFLVVLGLASLIECFGRFAIVGRGTPAPIAPTRDLVVSGQYRYVRNPMYLAVVAVILGQALLMGHVGTAIYGAGIAALFHVWVRVYEEPTLRRQFGRSYQEYQAAVGRWWPRRTPFEARRDPG